MTERRKPRPPSAALRSKVRQIEGRLARLEEHLGVLRAEATRTRGPARIRLKRLERKARVQVARAQRTLRDSVERLSRALAAAETREEVARHLATARATLQDSLDRVSRTLAQSSKSLKQEVGLLSRGLRAGIRAGAEAYRRERD